MAAEVAPWSKAGGLGDVMDALPIALAARGLSVMSVAPAYQPYKNTKDMGLIVPLASAPPRDASANRKQAYKQARLRAVVDKGVLRVFVSHPLLSVPEGKNIYSSYLTPSGEARDIAVAMQVSSLSPLRIPRYPGTCHCSHISLIFG